MNLFNIKYEKNSFDNIANPKYKKIESFFYLVRTNACAGSTLSQKIL